MMSSTADLKPIYNLRELSDILGMHHTRVKRLLVAAGIAFQYSGRACLIPIAEIEDKLPRVWDSIMISDQFRMGRAARL